MYDTPALVSTQLTTTGKYNITLSLDTRHDWYKLYSRANYEELEESRSRDLQVNLHLKMEENERWLPTAVSSPHTSWLKNCLRNCVGPRPDVEHAVHTDHATHHSFCSIKLLIVAFLVTLALAVMGLLLFWNYQCIFVWHLCFEDGEISSAFLETDEGYCNGRKCI
ncbi:hypothetical protein AMELA_G00204590 [Ameiurus melas]|uniref:Uncharacterized protein n=1 Tax=Ameiurus melas TaxID=219545 RepID=A0A7J6A4Q7_AMEME|nr:hypothetical protein AMELA_G00204590 [Ameiurus melas]